MKTTFEELFSDISVLDKRLSTPTEFHRAEQVSYHHTARLIAKRILLPAMPEGQDPERWKVKVDRALDRITAPLLAINSADDLVNPPELGLMEKLMPRVAHGKYVLLPTTWETRGHGTHSVAEAWSDLMVDFLKATAP